MLVYGRYRGMGEVDASGIAGSVVAAESDRSASRAIFVGVATGVLVWTITKILDRMFDPSPSRKQ